MTVINFVGYSVKEMIFEQKELLNQNNVEKQSIKQNFHTKTDIRGNKANVQLEYHVAPEAPIKLDVIIVGQFVFNSEEDKTNTGFEKYLKTNAVAILFPYLRQVVTTLTATSNIMQPIILPTVNISQLLYGKNN